MNTFTRRTPLLQSSRPTSCQLWDDSPSAPNNQNPRSSLLPSGLIPNAMYTGSLATFPRRMDRNVQSK